MRDSEEAAFARGVTAEALMDAAAAGIVRTVVKFFPHPGHCVVFAGKGNNAGDALAAAALLAELGWRIDLRLTSAGEDCGELARKKLARLRPMCQDEVAPGQFGSQSAMIILDGLLGLGATPPLREPIRSACRELNELRREKGAYVFALDLPTGLDADSGLTDEDCVVADFTITIGFAKRGLVADRALNFVGRLEVVPLVELHAGPGRCEAVMATAESLRNLLPRRRFGAYKNEFGRIGVVAGSKGFAGAALLCSLGALRAGAGLVELFVPEDIYSVVASTARPEVMVKSVVSYDELLEEKIDVWAIGPGIGRAHPREVLRLLELSPKPTVIDADALTILAGDMATLERSAGPRLLTPHPGEMKRIFPSEGSRAEVAARFCEKYPATLLLKGSRTVVSERGRPPSYNTTGNPGMATGGMGDVLTGVCAALIAQGLSPYDAARLGAWACGRASEIAIFDRHASEQSLLPADMVDNLGRAFREIQNTEG